MGLNDLVASTDDLDVSILVNNVGVLHFGSLVDRDIASVAQMISVNVNAQTYMSMFLLPRFMARKESKK